MRIAPHLRFRLGDVAGDAAEHLRDRLRRFAFLVAAQVAPSQNGERVLAELGTELFLCQER